MNDRNMIEQIHDRWVTIKTAGLGMFGAIGSWWGAVEAGTKLCQLLAAFFGMLIAGISLYRLMWPRRRARKLPPYIMKALAIGLFLCLCTGCTFAEKARKALSFRANANATAIAEESRALTTAVVDSLQIAPTNKPTDLALKLAKKDQQIEGMPQKRIDVPAILADDKWAIAGLTARLKAQDALIVEKAALESKLRETESRLIEMGKLYEAERNKNIVKRVWHWALGTFGIAGAIAFFIFCPAIALPLATQLARGIVALFPKLYGFFGVVGKGAFDAVYDTVESVKEKLKDDDKNNLHFELSRRMDGSHKRLVRARRSLNPNPLTP